MSKPFKGNLFCPTCIPQDIKDDLAEKISDMGGTLVNPLTSDVRYLIVGDRDSDKFRYSVKYRPDIIFLRPKSIKEIYEEWLQGTRKELSFSGSELPVFEGLRVCLTRTKEPSQREEFQKLIEDRGGKVSEALTMGKSCIVTSEKSGKRYEKALEWKIPTLDLRWVTDSVKRGAMLDMNLYDISKLPANRLGKGACNWRELDEFVTEEDVRKKYHDCSKSRERKRNTEEDHLKVVKRNPKIWKSIMEGIKPSDFSVHDKNVWGTDSIRIEGGEVKKNFEKAKKMPLEGEIVGANSFPSAGRISVATSNIFSGFHFFCYGFNEFQVSILSRVITLSGGKFCDSGKHENFGCMTHLLVPHSFTRRSIPGRLLESFPKTTEIITDWFVERSLHYKKIMNDRWGRPLCYTKLGVNLKVCVTGFCGVELLHIIKLIKILGFEYCGTLTKAGHLLVINLSVLGIGFKKDRSSSLFSYEYSEIIDTPSDTKLGAKSTKNKIVAAKKWSIPIVSAAFLWEASELGELPSLLDYRWCIFAPKFDSDTSYQKLGVQTVGTATPSSYNQTDPAVNVEVAEHLPSPTKAKKKWGRIVGQASVTLRTEQVSPSPLPPPDPSDFIDYPKISYDTR
ncbi:DNA replication initiation protein [Komagataella phaffii CBS 7435]|uniref:DNA Polymerase II Epsilon complex with BRCT domain n=2 Tax=Komagataella phaffii TaxID=460519 RepID=C4R998_KOMPG|nr:DNA Polymerase II Epsilon complex with BRCT domain [Komagataella phaffii GS115]AOA64718.1 GQ67_05334T0 [Komagataella phaffii]CAH2450392.1 DNA replication initiation protein [Komagataella phaffii CBS 7435]AOA70073.1 GQ68_05279T0 [Komagataella phaffii GS115]CAY72173.1 DNA Polymerase II Epsilon complex with BRCT domain [Komagataella phaffii GS115]CCA40228.1 DNA replication initiation protein [Komagataella phaffii CBS 7435]